MSEILSEFDLNLMERGSQMAQEADVGQFMRLLASHRQLQREVDALKKKGSNLQMRCEALQSELQHWTFESFKNREAELIRQLAALKQEAL